MQHKPRRGYKENCNRLSTLASELQCAPERKRNLHMHYREINRQMIKLEKMIAINIRNDEYTNSIYT